MYDEVLTRNEDGELEVRVTQASGDTGTDKDDVFTRDDDGNLALRVTGIAGGGGGTSEVRSVNGKKGAVVLTGADINATVTKSNASGNEEVTETITQHLQYLNDFGMTLQGEVDTNAGKTAELDADVQGKVDKSQGVENAGKALVVGSDGNVTLGTSGGGSGSDNNGLEGDYATTYGIVDETTSGLPYIKAVGSTVVVIPAGLVLDVPGQSGLTTVASAIEYEVVNTDNPTLFLAQGTVIEASDVFFQVEEPEDGTTGYAAWWNGTTWQFKSNDTGNVWRPANAVRIAKTVFTGTSLTRLCFTGCRVLNKQEYLSKSGGTLTGPLVSPSKVQAGFQEGTVLSLRTDTVSGVGTPLNFSLTSNGERLTIPADLRIRSLLSWSTSDYLGSSANKWKRIYVNIINNGADIAVPTTGGTMALTSDIDAAVGNISIALDAINGEEVA